MDIIHEKCDVTVVGGGTTGLVAAIQAARAGARASLIEMGRQLGGTMTTNGVSVPGDFFAWDQQVLRALLRKHGAIVPNV